MTLREPNREPHVFSIPKLNRASLPEAVALLELVTERSPWLAARLAALRPFYDIAALKAHLQREIMGLSPAQQLALVRAHPELAPAAPDMMTAASQQEQHRLGLARPQPREADRLRRLNAAYQARFGFPFVIALHACADYAAMIAQFESRLRNPRAREITRALSEVVSVASARLDRLTQPAQDARAPDFDSERTDT
ncbi:Uric acid degradation bifunctional protein [Aquimixticola soesokkakensis]|uniref:2-oxo-4-hydroxy-4-carboxy-5-ureidoimidazoline decarboxylase n=1 Tax=Aquimixticola soesokkakensis TaxID=1519096 RepID=A0A1Y5RXP3_9RHOB|nr:2-oxo-4-hydroxy-4-carboxy-5-ureidoimidazoline decarboxylase [Aquimixticola soesokkakensis]SLN27938.1 Uric acid degradation bifunctional protein [Aquimixticola soesokkakensis]